jgi:late competence protein required for DNA uptake (superfamily II DNA/RNA helicase)
MAIKRTKWDAVFSNLIRFRDDWTCQRCHRKYEVKSKGLHCSHFYGRRSWATRLEPDNAMALCHGCHLHVSSFPMDHVELWEKKFSKQRRDRINKLHNQTLIKKKDVATEENLKLLKLLLFKYIGVL